ncbi:MAG TPA: LysR substrate-binding domain-containing protein [Kribbellaceae bacterium]|nr:LysR substrate-binding domain-containing protein [Kribbellaceae bacterium]
MPEVWPLPVDIRLVESFAAVAEELHFTRAAQRLSVSQPALSQQIARLERQLGAQLFTRLPGAVALTPAGEALWREVQPALAGLRAGLSAARVVGAGVAGRLDVQHLSSYGPHVLPLVAAQLRETEPELVVELREASVEEQLEALRQRVADVGVFHLDPDVELDAPGITTITLATAPRYVALPGSHVFAQSPTLSLDQLAEDVWVVPVGASERSVQEANFVAACRRHGFEPRISQRANSIETMLGLVASGFGVAPAPWPVALRPPPSVHLARVADDHHRVVVAHRDDTAATPIMARFVAAASAVVAALLADLEPDALVTSRDSPP